MSPLTALVRRTQRTAQAMAISYAEGNMTARIRVTRPGEPFFDRVSGRLEEGTPVVLWEGAARIYTVQGPVTMALGDEPQYFSTTFISIPLRAELPRVDDVVLVLDHEDPSLPGRYFRVQDVEGGGQLPVAYRMQVIGIQPSPQWVDQR